MKKTALLYLALTLFFGLNGNSQIAVEYSDNNYIRYEKGTLPIVISIPHDGSLKPDKFPNRTCPRATTVQDTHTMEVGEAIAAALEKFTGKYPNMIYNELSRTKLDANRFKKAATCGNEALYKTWEAYHNFISEAQAYAASMNEGHVFYIDLHCHGHSIKRLELGYLLRGGDLERSDSVINTKEYINRSSFKSLVNTNKMNLSHSELIRGKFALGTLLTNRGFPSVPSLQDPSPGYNNAYFNGGANTVMHTSFSEGNNVPGLQIEIDYYGTLSNAKRRADFAEAIALALINFFKIHMNYDLSNNIITLTPKNTDDIITYPNPLNLERELLTIKGISITQKYKFTLIDVNGKIATNGIVHNSVIKFGNNLSRGTYILSLANMENKKVSKMRIILE